MSAEAEEPIIDEVVNEMPSLNHSVICPRVLRQLIENQNIEPLPELTLDIDRGITPDNSVFPKERIKPDFRRDITRFPEKPVLAIEVISASRNIQDLPVKAGGLVASGVKAVCDDRAFYRNDFRDDRKRRGKVFKPRNRKRGHQG